MRLFLYKILKHCENKTNVVYHVKTEEWIYQCVIVYNLDLEIQKKKVKKWFYRFKFCVYTWIFPSLEDKYSKLKIKYTHLHY